MFIATKLVEVKRYAPGPMKECQDKLRKYQVQIDALMKQLQSLKASNGARKSDANMREAEDIANKALESVEKLKETADKMDCEDLTAIQIRQFGEATKRAEAAATRVVTQARERLTKLQLEAKT